MPKRVTANYTDYDDREWVVTFTENKQRDIVAVSYKPVDGKAVPLSTRLPLLRILESVREPVPEMTLIPSGTQWQDSTGRTWTSHGKVYLGDDAPRKRRTMTETHYKEVATVYKSNRHHNNPTERVQQHFNEKDPPVSYTTAARWVKECRTARGFNTLPPTTRGKKT